MNKPLTDYSTLHPQEKAQVLFQKAIRLHQAAKLDEALKYYTQVIHFDPTFADAYNNMAVALRKQGRFDVALTCYKRSLSYRPDHAATYSNMGNVLNDLDRLEESIAAHSKAVELRPDEVLYLYNAGLVLRDAGKCTEAIAYFDKVLNLDPDYKNCRWDRALTYLLDGQFEKGFADYDARWKLDRSPPRTFPHPRWNGEALNGKTLFIHREQGFGDAIQFVRLIVEIKHKFNPTIILECQPELIDLFQQIDAIDQLIPSGQMPPAFDFWIPFMSLGHILQLNETTIPRQVPYLHAGNTTRTPLPEVSRHDLNIGIVWAGSPTHQNDRRRTTTIERFLPLANQGNTSLYSLQKGPAHTQLENTGATCLILDVGKDLKTFADSAAMIDQLDLIISVDTSVAHLAGAMGKEVWLLLPYTPDWRWMWRRTDSPWYPTMRLFRQDQPGDWDSCFRKVYRALEDKRLRMKRPTTQKNNRI